MKRLILITLHCVCFQLLLAANTIVTISNPETWRASELNAYKGQTIEFSVPFYVTNNYNGLTISPRRIYSPTNQEYPGSEAYQALLNNNYYGTVKLTNVSGYHRLGERLVKLVVKVNSSTQLSLVSCQWEGNTREELEKGYDKNALSVYDTPSLIVCTMNLEYYLVENLGTGYGAENAAEHQKQRAKVSKALALINADIYGFVEIEQGQAALAELAADLTKNTGRKFSYVNDGGSASGSYTKAGYVYCTDKVETFGALRENNTGVKNRKKTQAFVEKATGEKFLFSLNHFKAKSGSNASGDNADKGDGQSKFNGDRVREAQSVLDKYRNDCVFYNDSDILIMGDLNAYAMEDPITLLRKEGMIDLHRSFHADSSYSYVYHGEAGYLDHALCNSTLYPQVTGMVVFHINSDESDSYTYDKSNDQTMFRCSDHDPVIVGLRLDGTKKYNPQVSLNSYEVFYQGATPCIRNAQGGTYRIYRVDGSLVSESKINSHEELVEGLDQGSYILNIYGQGKCLQTKLIVR